MRRRSRILARISFASLALLGACSGGGDGGTAPGGGGGGTVAVASVAVSPGTAALQADVSNSTLNQTTLSATPKDASGNALSGRSITWASDNNAVATVSSAGVVQAVAAGTAHITATSGSASGSATITVTRPAIATLQANATSTALLTGTSDATLGQATMTVTAKDASGNTLTNRTVTYSTDAGSVATVSSTGAIQAVAPGTAHITATSEGQTGTVTVAVTRAVVATVQVTPANPTIAVGGTVSFNVTPLDAAGHPLTGRLITTSVNNGHVSVSGGVATGVSSGTTIVTFTIEGVAGTATVTVQ